MGSIEIRRATPNDAEKILAIYATYVTNTVISFEYDVPTIDEFKSRIENTLKRYPYLVAESAGEIVGYAYAGIFKPRAAYNHSAEVTVYIREDSKRLGIGRLLYKRLEELLLRQNVLNLNACVAYTDEPDKYLTNDSREFHLRMGYSLVGRFHKCGYKLGGWYDMIWLEKLIAPHEDKPSGFIPFSELSESR